MAGYGKYSQPIHETDGGEAKPRPRRAERLVDLMEDAAPGPRSPRSIPAEPRRSEERRAIPVGQEERPTEPYGRTSERATEWHREPRAPRPAEHRAERLPERLSERLPERLSQPTILSVTPEGEGETLTVVLALPLPLPEEDSLPEASTPNGSEHREKAKRVKLRLLVEQYVDLQEAGLALRPGEITHDQAEDLMRAGELCAAIRRGMSLLQYGDRSARRLASGLMAKGAHREIAEAAAAYLMDKGYIREDDTARRFAEQDLRKGWGPRRIREDLRARGFTPESVDEAMAALEEVDFSEACATVIRKKYGEVPADYTDRRKMTASLMRLGYDSDHIREASRQVAEGE